MLLVSNAILKGRSLVRFRSRPLCSCNHGSSIVYDFERSANDPSLVVKRHSAAHILAMAVQKLYPDAQATIGPCVENGYELVKLLRGVIEFL